MPWPVFVFACRITSMNLATFFLVVALIIFAIGAWSRWWPPAPQPYYPSFICMGLFFVTLAQLWPVLGR